MDQSAGSRSESDDISVSGAGEPPAAKKVKQCGPTSAELKPGDVNGTFHPSGPKFLNVWLWKHYKLSPRANCDKWALCALCQKWIPRSDGSTTRMKKHLIDVYNMYVGGFMHLMHAFVAHPCMRNDGCMRFLCYSEEPAKQTDSKGVASAQGRG